MKKHITHFLLFALLFLPLSTGAQLVLSEFNPSVLVPDTVFTDTQTFGGPEGIQQFFESKGSILAQTSPDFLAKLNEPTNPLLKEALGDPHPGLDHPRSAAELIWDASQSSGLNPQIILVTLNKEQGLITGTPRGDLQRALDHSMGFSCPDSTGCGNLFPGFYYQLFGNVDTAGNRYLGAAKSLVKSFSTPGGRGPQVNGRPAKVGDAIVLNNTLGGYDGIAPQQSVVLANAATAALYRYTPHVFNGNYNFWKFFTAWFHYRNGTLIKLLDSDIVYILENGLRQQVPPFVAKLRNLNLATATTVSGSEFFNYQSGPSYGPVDGTLVVLGSKRYVFQSSIKRLVSDFVLAQRKLDTSKAVGITEAEAAIYSDGSPLPPNDGTVIKGQSGKNIFLVKNGVLKLFSPFTFRQYNVAKKIQRIADAELASYDADGYVPPQDGTLIKSPSSTNAYIMNQGYKRPLTDELFRNLGYTKKQIVMLSSDAELASIPLGTAPVPKDGTYFSIDGSNELYLFKDGARHKISSFVAHQRKIKPAYSFEAGIATNWPDGIVVPPLDGTLVKSTSAADVFVVLNGQLHLLNTTLFKNNHYSMKRVVTLSDAEIEELPTDGYAPPAEDTYFQVKETRALFWYTKGAKRSISPLVAKQRSITPDVIFESAVVDGWPDGAPVAPRDNTLLRGDTTPTIYVVRGGTLRPVSDKVLKRHRFKKKDIVVVPQAEVDGYVKDGALLR